jgi:hypothetical protein
MYFYCKSVCILIVCPCILNLVYVFLLLSMYSYFWLCILIVRPCILIVVYIYLLLSMYSCCSSMYSYRCICILIVVYVFLDAATLTEVFPCFFLSCKANARVKLTKKGHGPHSSKLLCCSMYCLFCIVLCIVCV